MEIKGIKFYALVGILTIAYIIGVFSGFGICASTQSAYANKNEVTNLQNISETQGVNYENCYIDGQRYIVFTSGASSMAVIKK